METPEGTVASFWNERVAASGDHPFLAAGDRSWTYREFDRWVNQLANGLRDAGVDQGTNVGILLPNSVGMIRLQLAVQKLGAIMVPLLPGSTFREAAYVLNHSEAEVLVTDTVGIETISEGREELTTLRSVYLHDVSGEDALSPLESTSADPPPEPSVGPMDTMAIMYTSGSTGRPKGVMQPQAGLPSAGRAIAERLGIGAGDRFVCAMPLFHTGGTHMILAPTIAVGAAMVLVERFTPQSFWPVVRKSRATVGLVVPTMMSVLETLPRSPSDRDHSLRVLVSHVRPQSFVDRFGVDVCTVWAMTETSGIGTLTEPGYDRYEAKLVGWPMPGGEVRIVAPDTGGELPRGERGELCFRHPHVMGGYFRDPENSARALADGWVRSGDIGSMDADGRVFFHGRLKNMIKRSGENIAGEEVEFAIMEHPGVEECVVTGVADAVRTEEVYALIVARPEHEPTPEELVEWCGERLARWKIPRYIQIRHEPFPRLANNKTDRSSVVGDVQVEAAWDRFGLARPTRTPSP